MRPARVSGCLAALALALTLCLGSAGFAWAWLQSPSLHGQADRVYACVGIKLDGPIRFGYAWDGTLSGLTPLYVALPLTACGYYPRPPFLALFGLRIFQF
jgi:hypothetical protein